MAIIKRLRLKNKILQESFLKIHNENRVNKISAKISVGLGYSLEDSASMKKKGDSFVLIAFSSF